MTDLNTLNAASLVALYNAAIDDYNPEGFASVKRFASKAKAIEAIDAMCAAGNLAVSFDGDTAVIVDATPDTGDEGDEGEAPSVGDGKGKARPWGFTLASDEYLKANPRGTEARETYRKARRKAARLARKAARAAKEAALDDGDEA